MFVFQSLKRLFIGRPIATADEGHQRLSKKIALPVFASDAISSTAYATDEILVVLLLQAEVGRRAWGPIIPIAIIVSSMAGGSGASMVLDVPQILATIDPNIGRTTAMFLYTSEVFGSLERADRRGVEANGLAMMGEVFATSLGANGDDSDLLRLLGVTGSRTDQPFRRIFPIGRRAGTQGALFGDGSLESIYRAVGRALAGMVGSPVALDKFIRYDLVNPNPQPTDDVWLGEGTSDPNSVLWGTFGYSSLSLGRDRYGEYVAQLLAPKD